MHRKTLLIISLPAITLNLDNAACLPQLAVSLACDPEEL